MPDERARVLRRRLARREQLVRARTRVKNEVHATLMRRLQGKPPCSDLFGVKGRKLARAAARAALPPEEAETVEAALRQIAFLDREIEQVERLVAKQMLDWPEAKRLLTVPGVNLIAAATFLAAVGDITRFATRASWSPTSGWTPGCASPASTPPARAGSQSAAPRGALGAGRGDLVGGPHSPGRCARSMRLRAAAGTARRSSPPRASSRCCSGACSPAARTTPTSSPR